MFLSAIGSCLLRLKIPLHDFRALRGAESKPSAELIDLLNDVILKRQWNRE
jgi:hypothetical protein